MPSECQSARLDAKGQTDRCPHLRTSTTREAAYGMREETKAEVAGGQRAVDRGRSNSIT
jgi:hypothetical protein